MERLERLDFAERRLVVVDLLERDGEVIREATCSVDVGVGAGSDPLEDLVLGDNFGSGVDAPALRRWRIHDNRWW